MIYLGNGLYSDSGNSLAHYGVKNMKWDPSKRKTNIDWSNPEQVQGYYAQTAGRVPRQVANRVALINDRARLADYRNDISRSHNSPRRIMTQGTRNFVRPSYRKSQDDEAEAREPKGGRVPTWQETANNHGRTGEQKQFIRPSYKSAVGAKVANATSNFIGKGAKYTAMNVALARNAAADKDLADSKRGGRGNGPKPHFATKEYQQEQANKRAYKDSQKAFSQAYKDQLARQQGSLYEAAAGGGLMRRRNINGPYESEEAMREAARRTNQSAQAGVEAGRRRVANKKTEERNAKAGIEAGRERRRNAENAKRGVESKSAHNYAVKGQENRGSGTLADFNYQKKMDNNENRKVAEYMRGNKKAYFDLDLGKRNTENGITAGRNRVKIKQAEDAFNKKIAADKQAKKDKQRKAASMPYEAFKEGSEQIVGSAYKAYKKGKKKLKKFFG